MACSHEFVMKMRLIGMERMLASEDTTACNTYKVKRGNQQKRIGKQQTVLLRGLNFIIGTKFQGQIAERIAQHQATGISHKDLSTLGIIAKKIIPKEY